MKSSNYLADFIYQLDILISEINKLDSKIRLYKKNSQKFGINFGVKFSISVEQFLKLRDFLYKKVECGSEYNRNIVNLKRNFSREFSYLILKIEQEIMRIENYQEKEMNKIVYKTIYVAKWRNEIDLMESYDCESSLLEKFLRIAQNRKLNVENHRLKAELVKKEYEQKKNFRKSIFELVNMLENTDVKSGDVLCLKDDMIKAFMVDRNTVKRNSDKAWRQAVLIPSGFLEKRAYYKILNKNLIEENRRLNDELEKDRIIEKQEKTSVRKNLLRLNSKLAKILSEGVSVKA